MPKALKFRDLVRILQEHDSRFEFYVHRGKGSHRMIYHPDISGRAASYPVPFHGDNREVGKGMLKAILRRFNLPPHLFD